MDPVIYDKLLESEEQLTKYLKYIRYKQPVPRIQLDQSMLGKKSGSFYKTPKKMMNGSTASKNRKESKEIKIHLERYFALVREVAVLENSMSKKIIKK